jgi:hypothetical protein
MRRSLFQVEEDKIHIKGVALTMTGISAVRNSEFWNSELIIKMGHMTGTSWMKMVKSYVVAQYRGMITTMVNHSETQMGNYSPIKLANLSKDFVNGPL